MFGKKPKKAGTLKVKEQTWDISDARIKSRTDKEGRQRWTVLIRTVAKETSTGGYAHDWAPAISCEDIPVDAPLLNKIEGKTILVSNSYENISLTDPDSFWDGHFFSIAIEGDQESMWDNSIEFLKKKGDKLTVYWTGRCDMAWDNEYGSDLPFEIECDLTIVKEWNYNK